MQFQTLVQHLDKARPILIAGATASGKSALALRIAAELGGVIVNADALQVYGGWRVLTARPSKQEETQAPHFLYGHVQNQASYSVGDWLRDITPILTSGQRLIIVGGTGLYFRALTEGLADIPPIKENIRRQSAHFLSVGETDVMLAALDDATHQRSMCKIQCGCRGLGRYCKHGTIYFGVACADPTTLNNARQL